MKIREIAGDTEVKSENLSSIFWILNLQTLNPRLSNRIKQTDCYNIIETAISSIMLE